MEALVEKHLLTVHDWERNFKALKIKGKEAERLPRYEKLRCFCGTRCDMALLGMWAPVAEGDFLRISPALGDCMPLLPELASAEAVWTMNYMRMNMSPRKDSI